MRNRRALERDRERLSLKRKRSPKFFRSFGSAVSDLPTAVFDFTTGLLDPRVTYTHGSSNSWHFDASGLLVSYPATTPRFDFGRLGGGACRGLRIDQSSLSVSVLHCRDFTNAVWTKTDVTAAKDAVGLDGEANACSTLTATADGGKATQSITSASGLRVFFGYVKRKTGTGTISITLDDGATSTDVTAQINASTFSEVYMTQTLANPVVGFIFGTNGDEVIVDGCTIDVAAMPTTPILTAGSNVQRVRDEATVTGVNFTDWFNPVEGTFIADILHEVASVAATGARVALVVDDTTGNERFSMFSGHNAYSGNMGVSMQDGGSTIFSQSAGAIASAGVVQRMGFAYQLNNSNDAANGTAQTTDTSCTIPTVTRMTIGGLGTGGSQINGVIVRIKYWPRRLPNALLAARTAL